MYAIVTTGGKQYKVENDAVIKVEKLDAEVNSEITLDVLMVNKDGEIICGDAAKSAKVKAQVIEHAKAKKIIVFKYKSKKNERKRQGHRQPFTALKIVGIEA
ncbi:MAG: 50S ribosomal protein L21 [Clostridia bacterium]|nr:50S ribosomal protein L21 [Clostridia bacterium]MCX4367112.1 50S ribosomal protein L21 [Clostridia bacterium]